MRVLLNILGSVAVLVLSFWLTLVAIDNWPAPKPSDFDIAMQREGLTLSASDSIASSVDSVRRLSDGRLVLSGWAVDKASGQPVSIRVLNGDKLDFVAMTKGPRADVTKALRLSPEQTKDVAFSGTSERPISCEGDDEFTIVAVDQKKQVSVLSKAAMPRC
jgi:hypothetical protein